MATIAIEEALYAILAQDQATSGLAGTRIEPQHSAQEKAHPRITYQRISTPRVRHLLGRSNLAHPRFQVNCLARSEAQAASLAAAVVNALDNGQVNQVVAGWNVRARIVEDERDHYSPDQHGADVGVFMRSVDVTMWFNEQ